MGIQLKHVKFWNASLMTLFSLEIGESDFFSLDQFDKMSHKPMLIMIDSESKSKAT